MKVVIAESLADELPQLMSIVLLVVIFVVLLNSIIIIMISSSYKVNSHSLLRRN